MELREAKRLIRIESADPQVNEWVHDHIQDPNDCFGMNYKPGHEECSECTVLSSIEDRKEPLNVFCAELCGYAEVKEGEVQGWKEKEVTGEMTDEKKIEGTEIPPDLSSERTGQVATSPTKKVNKTKVVREMYESGKTLDEVVAAIGELYKAEGKTDEWIKANVRGRMKWELLKLSKK